MRKILFTAATFISFTAFGQPDLEMTGFKVMENTSKVQVLNFQNSTEFRISKERFLNQQSAIQFCIGQKSKLDTKFNALLIAMSGAANVSSFLNESISFKIRETSGIWQWSRLNDKVTVMLNGNGTVTEEIAIEDLNKVVQISLPAICVKNL